MNKKQESLDAVVKKAKEIHGDRIEKIILFGSYAREEAEAKSDINLLVITSGERFEMQRNLSWVAVDILLEMGVYISPKAVTMEECDFLKKINTGFIRTLLGRVSLLDEAELPVEEAGSKLRSAKILYGKSEYGDAINRAYRMHYATRALLSTKNIFPKTHKGAISKFGLEFVKDGVIEEYHTKAMSTARESKEKTDYGVGSNKGGSEEHNLDAERFL